MALDQLSRASNSLLASPPCTFISEQGTISFLNDLGISSLLVYALELFIHGIIKLLYINSLRLGWSNYSYDLRLEVELRGPNFEFSLSSREGVRIIHEVNWSLCVSNNVSRHGHNFDIRVRLYFLNHKLKRNWAVTIYAYLFRIRLPYFAIDSHVNLFGQ